VDRPHPQKSADLSPHLTADRSSQAVLSGCRLPQRSPLIGLTLAAGLRRTTSQLS